MNSPLFQKSQEIFQKASRLIERKQIIPFLSQRGDFKMTGSFALDLMTWNDIDMQLVPNSDYKVLVVEIFSYFSNSGDFVKAKVVDFYKKREKTQMTEGYYLGFELIDDEKWKIDIWLLNREAFDKNTRMLKELKNQLTPEIRQLILDLKFEWTSIFGRVPQFYSYYLYEGVLKGLRHKSDLYAYVESHSKVS